MNDVLRSAIIGTGFMGEVHARAVRAAGGVVSVVAGSSAERAREALPRVHAARAAENAAEAITADDVDIVHVCTPNATHAGLAALAFEHGKHVICEKPLGLDTAETAELVGLGAGRVTAVPFAYRFYPTVREARARCLADDTGAIRIVHGSYLQDWLADPADTNWRVDPAQGGRTRVFGDIGVHWCDLAEFVTGHRITRLQARFTTVHPERGPVGHTVAVGTEDVATMLFETDRGAVGTLVISQVSWGRRNQLRLSIDGDTQGLAFDQEQPDTLWVGRRDTVETVHRGLATAHPDAVGPYVVVPPGHPQGYQECFTALVLDVHRAVRGEQPDGLPTFADGHRAAVLTEAAARSAAEDLAVEVAP